MHTPHSHGPKCWKALVNHLVWSMHSYTYILFCMSVILSVSVCLNISMFVCVCGCVSLQPTTGWSLIPFLLPAHVQPLQSGVWWMIRNLAANPAALKWTKLSTAVVMPASIWAARLTAAYARVHSSFCSLRSLILSSHHSLLSYQYPGNTTKAHRAG